jgi:hypothetical protein
VSRRGLPEDAFVIQGDESAMEMYSNLITASFTSDGNYEIDGWRLRALNPEREPLWEHAGSGIRVHGDSLRKMLAELPPRPQAKRDEETVRGLVLSAINEYNDWPLVWPNPLAAAYEIAARFAKKIVGEP